MSDTTKSTTTASKVLQAESCSRSSSSLSQAHSAPSAASGSGLPPALSPSELAMKKRRASHSGRLIGVSSTLPSAIPAPVSRLSATDRRPPKKKKSSKKTRSLPLSPSEVDALKSSAKNSQKATEPMTTKSGFSETMPSAMSSGSRRGHSTGRRKHVRFHSTGSSLARSHCEDGYSALATAKLIDAHNASRRRKRRTVSVSAAPAIDLSSLPDDDSPTHRSVRHAAVSSVGDASATMASALKTRSGTRTTAGKSVAKAVTRGRLRRLQQKRIRQLKVKAKIESEEHSSDCDSNSSDEWLSPSPPMRPMLRRDNSTGVAVGSAFFGATERVAVVRTAVESQSEMTSTMCSASSKPSSKPWYSQSQEFKFEDGFSYRIFSSPPATGGAVGSHGWSGGGSRYRHSPPMSTAPTARSDAGTAQPLTIHTSSDFPMSQTKTFLQNRLLHLISNCTDEELLSYTDWKAQSDIDCLRTWLKVVATTITCSIEEESRLIHEWESHFCLEHSAVPDADDEFAVGRPMATTPEADASDAKTSVHVDTIDSVDIGTAAVGDSDEEDEDEDEKQGHEEAALRGHGIAQHSGDSRSMLLDVLTSQAMAGTRTMEEEAVEGEHDCIGEVVVAVESAAVGSAKDVEVVEDGSVVTAAATTIVRRSSVSLEILEQPPDGDASLDAEDGDHGDDLKEESESSEEDSSEFLESFEIDTERRHRSVCDTTNLLSLPDAWLMHLIQNYLTPADLLLLLPLVCKKFRLLSAHPTCWRSLHLTLELVRNIDRKPQTFRRFLIRSCAYLSTITFHGHIEAPNDWGPWNHVIRILANHAQRQLRLGTAAAATAAASAFNTGSLAYTRPSLFSADTVTGAAPFDDLSPAASLCAPLIRAFSHTSPQSTPTPGTSLFLSPKRKVVTGSFGIAVEEASAEAVAASMASGTPTAEPLITGDSLMIDSMTDAPSDGGVSAISTHRKSGRRKDTTETSTVLKGTGIGTGMMKKKPPAEVKAKAFAVSVPVIDTLYIRCRHISRRGPLWLRALKEIRTIKHIHCAALSRADDVEPMLEHFPLLQTLNVNVLGPAHQSRQFDVSHHRSLQKILEKIPETVIEFAIPVSVTEAFVREAFTRMPRLENLDFFRLTTPHTEVNVDSWACCLSADSVVHLAECCPRLRKCQIFVRAFNEKNRTWHAVKQLLALCPEIRMLTIGMEMKATFQKCSYVSKDKASEHQCREYFSALKKVPWLNSRFHKFKKKVMKFPNFSIVWCLLA